MSDQDQDQGDNPTEAVGTVDATAQTGTVASHPERLVQPFLVAPTTEKDFNTLSLDLVAVACVQLPDILFEFDSSFPNPSVAAMLKQVPPLRQKHKNAKGQLPPLSIFGHADPSGDDDYNKQLSGRRAMAIYGVLTRDFKLWDFLFDNPHGGDNWKSKNVLATMRSVLGEPAGKPRRELVQAYMNLLSPEPLQKSEFIGQGGDAKGKADFQGCSEFNPLLLLSTKEIETLPKAKRNEENASNRRVIIFLFRAGMKVNPKLWPCPTALAGTADCFKRFFGPPKTGNERRKPGPERREFAKTLDTFACRFYDRVARLSPCELPVPPVVLGVNPLIFFESAAPVVTAPGATAAKGSTSSLVPSVGAAKISVAKDIVLVKKSYTNPPRVPVILKTDASFDGNGLLTINKKDTIFFFPAQNSTDAQRIQFNGTDNLFKGAQLDPKGAGVTIFAEGRKGSVSMKDVALTLKLSGGTKKPGPDAVAQMTAIELLLDICAPRVNATTAPVPLPQPPDTAPAKPADKFFLGRPVPIQDEANIQERAMLMVQPVKTTGFKDQKRQLVLIRNGDKVKTFTRETPDPKTDQEVVQRHTLFSTDTPTTFF
ncbi:MAG: OmpA family protein, partial [Burkholderiales bacterium]